MGSSKRKVDSRKYLPAPGATMVLPTRPAVVVPADSLVAAIFETTDKLLEVGKTYKIKALCSELLTHKVLRSAMFGSSHGRSGYVVETHKKTVYKLAPRGWINLTLCIASSTASQFYGCSGHVVEVLPTKKNKLPPLGDWTDWYVESMFEKKGRCFELRQTGAVDRCRRQYRLKISRVTEVK